MFLMTIQNLGTDEQVEKWGVPAQNYRIHGCYAQTELGHGSNVNVRPLTRNDIELDLGNSNNGNFRQGHRLIYPPHTQH